MALDSNPVANTSSGVSAAPVGGITTTETAMGLGLVAGFTITPTGSGRVIVSISGAVTNAGAAGSPSQITGRYGTGVAPSNGATSGLGTVFGTPQHIVSATATGQDDFVTEGLISGLAVGVPVWFDISLLGAAAAGATVKDVQVVIDER